MTDSARFKFSAPWLLSEGVWYITVQFVTLIAKADLFYLVEQCVVQQSGHPLQRGHNCEFAVIQYLCDNVNNYTRVSHCAE